MVRGFDAFQQHNRDAILIIKALTSPERFTLDLVVLDVMVNKLASGSSFANDNIIVFNQFLTDEEMSALYDLADFYLCTSIAEGQNLPLLEAMARGVVPVTTRTTAMLDYIDPRDAVIIGTDSVLNENPHLAGCIAGKAVQRGHMRCASSHRRAHGGERPDGGRLQSFIERGTHDGS